MEALIDMASGKLMYLPPDLAAVQEASAEQRAQLWSDTDKISKDR